MVLSTLVLELFRWAGRGVDGVGQRWGTLLMGVDVSLGGRVVEIEMSRAWAWSRNAGPGARETPSRNRAGPRREE